MSVAWEHLWQRNRLSFPYQYSQGVAVTNTGLHLPGNVPECFPSKHLPLWDICMEDRAVGRALKHLLMSTQRVDSPWQMVLPTEASLVQEVEKEETNSWFGTSRKCRHFGANSHVPAPTRPPAT